MITQAPLKQRNELATTCQSSHNIPCRQYHGAYERAVKTTDDDSNPRRCTPCKPERSQSIWPQLKRPPPPLLLLTWITESFGRWFVRVNSFSVNCMITAHWRLGLLRHFGCLLAFSGSNDHGHNHRTSALLTYLTRSDSVPYP